MSVVLDSSAVLALLLTVRGAETVSAEPGHASISSVNWCGVLQTSVHLGLAEEIGALSPWATASGLTVADVTADDALLAAELWENTRQAGLSLADRACLALASRLGCPAITADRAWADIGRLGVAVEVIR